jgi:hypothetical protein
MDDLAWTAEHGTPMNRMMTGAVGLPVCAAIRAFGAGRHAEAVAAIEPARDGAFRFGGSHAQRDVLTLTLIQAAIRSGQLSLARHYIAERTVHKPQSGWGWRLLARTHVEPSESGPTGSSATNGGRSNDVAE